MRKRVWFVAANDATASVGASVATSDGVIDGASVGATLCLASPIDATIIIVTMTATAPNSIMYEQNVLIYTDRTEYLYFFFSRWVFFGKVFYFLKSVKMSFLLIRDSC